jgi:hypothetical protein
MRIVIKKGDLVRIGKGNIKTSKRFGYNIKMEKMEGNLYVVDKSYPGANTLTIKGYNWDSRDIILLRGETENKESQIFHFDDNQL